MSASESTESTEIQIKASEAAIKINELIAEMELIMRQPEPNRILLAVIRANCRDIESKLADIDYWAVKKYRGEL
jgi:hypothetical protein